MCSCGRNTPLQATAKSGPRLSAKALGCELRVPVARQAKGYASGGNSPLDAILTHSRVGEDLDTKRSGV